ncbi:hypothetical protein C5Y96_01235 [Blastopirellula marina]|uniref:Uncharacterized protein n=1 Tax=Blastopirellula marina TaxID=124 RepID=A0A2S8G8W3_9BACT|nr:MULTISPECIES: hypothetical protein [Pirellulaceae]PQO40750.1 hypothetical protein C5Y96_01235 [Blastopirellula marina]RCS56060.1 hypothetical protein DTL36_01235 [Bremerella cremea]
MARVFTGPVELSEIPTPSHTPLFIGTQIRLTFQCREITADVNSGSFPAIKIGTQRVQTFQEWQQHEVLLNGFLVGTIDKASSGPQEFVFPFQPRVLKVDATAQPHELPLDAVNVLTVQIGSGGFGLNDSFDVEYIDFEGFNTSLG